MSSKMVTLNCSWFIAEVNLWENCSIGYKVANIAIFIRSLVKKPILERTKTCQDTFTYINLGEIKGDQINFRLLNVLEY